MSVFAVKWQEDILKDILRDLQLCSENDKSIKLNFNQIDILLKYIEYLYNWVLDKDKKIERLNKEKVLLQCDLDNANSKLRDSMAIRLKAIGYIEHIPTQKVIRVFKKELLEILKGE